MELEGKIINFLGDSITEGARVDDPQNIYVARIGRMCGLKAANNYGISGILKAHLIKVLRGERTGFTPEQRGQLLRYGLEGNFIDTLEAMA